MSGTSSLRKIYEKVPIEFSANMERIIIWCEALEREGLAKLDFNGRKHANLAIRTYRWNGVQLAKINYVETDAKGPWLYLNPLNLRQNAPKMIPQLSEESGKDLAVLKRPGLLYLSDVSDTLLAALTEAYREAHSPPTESGGTGD